MEKKLVTFIIVLSIAVPSIVGFNSMKVNAKGSDAAINVVNLVSKVLEACGLDSLHGTLTKLDIDKGRATQYIGYLPTSFEQGKFYISAFETNKPLYKSDIYYIKVYDKYDPYNFKEYNLQSNQQLAISTPNDGNEYMVEVYTYKAQEKRGLVTFLIDEKYKNKNYGIALSRRFHSSSNFYLLKKRDNPIYDIEMLRKYAGYNPAKAANEEIYYRNMDSKSPGREFCIDRAEKYRGINLKEDNIKFSDSNNQKILQQWRDNHSKKLITKGASFKKGKLQIAAKRESLNARKDPFEVEIINQFSSRKFDVKVNERLDLESKLEDNETCILKLYQKDSNNNRTEIDSIFISKRFIKDKGFGISLISTTDKPKVEYIRRGYSGIMKIDRNQMVDMSKLKFDSKKDDNFEAHNMISDWNAKRYSFWNDKYTIYASSEELEESNEGVKNLVDGDNSTTWCTKWDKSDKNRKHITIALDKNENKVNSFTYTPRQDESLNGTITKYKISVSDNGVDFRQVASGDWALNADTKRVDFNAVPANYVRLEVIDSNGGWASGSEILFGMERREGGDPIKPNLENPGDDPIKPNLESPDPNNTGDVEFSDGMLEIIANRESSNAKKDSFEVEILNQFSSRKFDVKVNERLDIGSKLADNETCILKLYQKDSNNNRTEIDSIFISKEFVKNKNFGISLISTTDKPKVEYIRRDHSYVIKIDRNEIADMSKLKFDPKKDDNFEAHNMISDWNAKRYSFWNDKHTIYASSEELEKSNESVKNLVDGDNSTTWCTKWDKSDKNSKHITIALDKNENKANFFTYTPRINQGLRGVITKYKISVSDNGVDFREIARGDWALNTDTKRVDFNAVSANYLRLEIVDSNGGWASGSEILFGMERREGQFRK